MVGSVWSYCTGRVLESCAGDPAVLCGGGCGNTNTAHYIRMKVNGGRGEDRGREGREEDRGREGREGERTEGGRGGKGRGQREGGERTEGGRGGKRTEGGRGGKRTEGGRGGKRDYLFSLSFLGC